MTSVSSFGEKQAIKLCKKLGFIVDKSKGKGGHAKATHPTKTAKDDQGRTTKFIIIRGKKEYSKSFRERFIKELTHFGFTKEEIIENI